MEKPARWALAAGSGYLLGRRKKLALAVTVGSLITGKRLPDRNALLAQGAEFIRSNPDFAELRTKLMRFGKSGAIAVATRQVNRATERLATRADAISGSAGRQERLAVDSAPDASSEPFALAKPSLETAEESDAVNGTVWQTLSETMKLARSLREQQDSEQMRVLLRDTDRWFADRLPPVPAVTEMASELTSFAEWAGMRYRLLDLLNDKSHQN